MKQADVEALLRDVLAATDGGNGWRANGGSVLLSGVGTTICTGAAPQDAQAIASAVGGVRVLAALLHVAEAREQQIQADVEDLQERLRDAGLDAALVRPDPRQR